MQVSRGKIHKYLGMTLDFTIHGQVKISMFDYIEEILAAFEKAEPKRNDTKSSAVPESLFKIDEDCEKLPAKRELSFTI